MAVEIRKIDSKKDLKNFVRFGINLYKDSAYAAPPLIFDDLTNLTKGKNPALEFCETVYFLAYRKNKIVGRIAGIIHPLANETWNNKHARFGWVDFIDDAEVVDKLFDAVSEWAKTKGMTHLHGPLGFTDFDNEGALIDGFDQMSTMATIYNYPYYIEHYERLGFIKEVDWKEYLVTVPEVFPERYEKFAKIVKEKYQFKTLKLTSKKLVVEQYAKKIFYLLNESYKELFGYTHLNDDQIMYYIKLYFSFFRLDTLSLVVDKDDNLVALGIAMPSFTKALQKAKGKLFPFGWYYMLKAIYCKNDLLDLYLMAVHPTYQNKGVNAILFADMIPNAIKNGYKYAETNPELETNLKMSSQWANFDYIHHKTRRVFIKEI